MRSITLASALVLGLFAAPAYADNMIATDGLKASPSSVTVGAVTADKAGYVVVHIAENGGTTPGAVIGEAPVKAGENTSVSVPLGKKVKAGTQLIVMLHEESNGDTKFDDKDSPATAGRGPVQQIVTVQ